MAKSFMDAFNEWKKESYRIGDDIGWEYSDDLETGCPTQPARSSTKENGSKNSAQAVLNPRQKA